ncbi:MAG: hypothetical protein PHD33_01420 [Atribacterota bacterium]|nr:hypothetical protein [Atribacterota bacterium]
MRSNNAELQVWNSAILEEWKSSKIGIMQEKRLFAWKIAIMELWNKKT